MTSLTGKVIYSCRKPLDGSPNRLGILRRSDDILGDAEAQRKRIDEDGYLYLPGLLQREEVLCARLSILRRLSAEGALDERISMEEAVAKPGLKMAFRADLANGNPEVESLVYSRRMMALMDGLLGGEAMHYDYTWLRAVAPGGFTQPHYDIVYMGRGTKRIFTAWTPMSDISFDLGGLAILENSHRLEDLKATYGTEDVDIACTNKPGVLRMNDRGYAGFGALSDDPTELAERFDRRWLVSEYAMGDVLLFTMFTLHCSTDNRTDRIRLSTDTRYQLASEPADERWIGESPPAHGPNSRKELIC